jgi:hypothetical protein
LFYEFWVLPSVPLTAGPSSLTALTIVSANSQAVFAGMARSYDTTLGVGHAGRNTTAGPGHARDWCENRRQTARTMIKAVANSSE